MVALMPAHSSAAENGNPLKWEPSGWGGGGFYYAAAFHPTRDGVIYLAGDVGGIYKTEDHGLNWRMINKGLVNYGVFSIAVDTGNPETVYAATEDGLCKSSDSGETWAVLPQTRKKELRITGEKGKSIRSVAVDTSDGNIVYAASPAGKVFKSTDGGQSWKVSYAKEMAAGDNTRIRVQFGKVDAQYFGGFWMPMKYPAGLKPEDAVGLSVNFKGDKSTPKDSFITLGTSDGLSYRSKNLRDLFADESVRDVVLKGQDFILDPEYVKKNPEKAAAVPATPEWPKIIRLDMSCSGPLPEQAAVASLASFSYAVTKTADGKTGTAEAPVLVPFRDFSTDKTLRSYGNIRLGEPAQGSIYSVAVSARNPALVVASTHDSGLVFSKDKGATWVDLSTPKKASSACFDPADPKVMYATFWNDGIWKSTDQGQNWKKVSGDLPSSVSFIEVAVSHANPLDVYAIGRNGWGGAFYLSNDGGATWKNSSSIRADYVGDPTMPEGGANTTLSVPTNLTINPRNPKLLYVSANWRSCFSNDGGLTWHERMKGADISCITDIRFSGKRVYTTAMDEGTLMSEDNGETWKQLWPMKHTTELSGHNWRIAVNSIAGTDRIIATASPWDKFPNRVVVSDDAGKSYKIASAGLPDYIPTANTMWGRGYARALAVDPSNPRIVYLGIDGDPADGNSGGGVFKSEDGGHQWKQLANQPGSRRMYYGLAIDPTNTQRIYWGGFGAKGGVYRSEDGGGTWQSVFTNDPFLFNVMTTADGTVYASGKNLWRSVDKGRTWNEVSHFKNDRSVVGVEVHPTDPNTIWISSTVWSGDAEGGIYKTTDGGVTWNEITGDIPFVRALVLRFNPNTNELWAGGVGLFKLKQ
ncbi:MAG: hypothetical protein ABIT37_05130 [Luteolibacter sp.]